MKFKLTRALNGEVRGMTEHAKLVEARRFAGMSLFDNGVLSKREAQELSTKLAPGSPIVAGGYIFTVEAA